MPDRPDRPDRAGPPDPPDRAARSDQPIRYAVVGLGHISQVAVLPAFQHAEGCELTALVSGDEEKRRKLSEKWGVPRTVHYDGYEELLASGEIDAVYIATPNHLHADQAVAAAERGVHVLCEKPMAVTEEECRRMIQAAADHETHLMIAYRLHFDDCNMEVAERVRDGAIGRARFFDSTFGQDVKEGDIRLSPLEKGGGSVYDMGIYCINAARYVFAEEPVAVTARSASRDDPRFADCDEMTSAVLEFPGDRLATFTSSFGSTATERYQVVGSDGEIRVDPCYSYVEELGYRVIVEGEVEDERTFEKRDQFAPELIHLATCIREGRRPEPDGREGLADVRIIQAIHRSAREGRRVELEPVEPQLRPDTRQTMRKPGVEKPEELKVSSPSE